LSMFLSDAPLRPGRPEAKIVAKLITFFLNFQTFSKKFLFLFSWRLPHLGLCRTALSRSPVGCFSKASAKLDTFSITSKFFDEKIMP
ncbi:hypothetical protein, partial [Muribaculum intestinale]|uniref:hypothetical protein n=1 Tax=Muribaculum intestinale TaxID=1796646 RepID=UPI0025B3E76F